MLVSSDAVQRCFHPCTTEKLFGIYFGGYTADISGDFVSSFKEHSKLCDEKDGTKGRK